MAVTVERLIATLEARIDKYEKDLAKAAGTTDRQFQRIERRGKQMESRMAAVGATIGRNLLGAFAAQASLRGAQQLIDAATRIENALKVAGLSGSDLEKVYDRLFASAQKNAAPLESLAQLYGRVAIVQKELGVSTEDLLTFTDNVAAALRVAGTDAQTASGALLQLSQALGSGVVRAEEFNSILEGALPVAQAAAAGLEEAGGSVAKLRQLVVDGKVSSEAFFRAFEAGAATLQEKVASAELTVSQGFVRLQNVLIDAARRFDDVTEVSRGTVELLDRLAGVVNGLSNVFAAAANGPIGTYIGRLSQLNDLIRGVLPGFKALGLLTEDNLNTIAEAIGGGATTAPGRTRRLGTDPVQARIDQAFGTGGAVQTVSLDDFTPPPRRGGGRQGRGTRENSYQREVSQIRERTDAILAETAALSRVNPLIDDYGYAIERAKAVHELLTAAQQAGIAVTPELYDQIEHLADTYATASVEAEKLAESQDRAREAAEELSGIAQDVLGGFIDDLRNGVSAADALRNALDKVLDRLIDIGLESLFSGGLFGGLGGAGLFGGRLIPGILHGGGVAGRDGYGHGRSVSPAVFAGAPRYHGGGVAGLRPGEVPAILQRGEVVLPRGHRIGGGGQQIVINAPINAPGADAAALARVEKSVRDLSKSIPRRVDERVNARQVRNTRP